MRIGPPEVALPRDSRNESAPAIRSSSGKENENVLQQARMAVLFADLCGSTGLYEALGDARARAVVARCTEIMAEATRCCRGILVKTIGDAVMASFSSADAAADAAAAMQEAITGRLMVDGRPIAIRVGFHVGSALVEEADLFGDAVNLPARLAGEAKAGQILISAATAAELTGRHRQCCRRLALARIRGKQQPIPLYELVWRPEDATEMREPRGAGEPAGGRLLVAAGGSVVEIGDLLPTVTIGRAQQNDIVVRSPLVSRLHARIDYRHGRFVLTDMSANGTWIVPEQGAAAFLHRDSEVLGGSGVLGLGEAACPEAPGAVRYAAVARPAFALGAAENVAPESVGTIR
jgi:adenylate cyclase